MLNCLQLLSTFVHALQNVTWEGDNNVLCLQTARFLLKAAVAAMAKPAAAGSSGSSASSERGAAGPPSTSGSLSGSASYLGHAHAVRGAAGCLARPRTWRRPKGGHLSCCTAQAEAVLAKGSCIHAHVLALVA